MSEIYNERMMVSKALIDIMAGAFEKDPETVLIAEGEKFINGLREIIEFHPGTRFTISCQNEEEIKLVKAMTDKYDNVIACVADIYSSSFIQDKFDLIFSSPVFGVRNLCSDNTFMCRETDMVAFENLLTYLKSDGNLVIILSGRVAFAQGRIGALREFIQSTYTLKEIDELPPGIFANTATQAYLISVQNSRPSGEDVIVKKYGAGDRRNKRASVEELILEDDTFVMLDELEEMGSWSVNRIFEQQSEEWQIYSMSPTKKEILRNVAEIFRGKNITKKEWNGKIGVINISNIGEYALEKDDLDYIDDAERKVSNYLLQEGDVLIPGRGTAMRSAVFHEEDFSFPCIASSNVIVIRPDAKTLKSLYLKLFLDSPIGKKVISQVQQGTFVMNLSYKDLGDIEIPLPPLPEQEEISLKYEYELRHFQETVAEAERRWREVLDELEKF